MFNLPLIRVHTELIKTKVDTRVDEFCLLHFSGINLRVKLAVEERDPGSEFFSLYAKIDKIPLRNKWCSWYHVLTPQGPVDQ